MSDKKLKVEFAPGAFDDFEGSQEELDQLMAEIVHMVESGEISKNSVPVDLDDLLETDPELAEKLNDTLNHTAPTRRLQ